MYETMYIIFMHTILYVWSLMYFWYFPKSECSGPVIGAVREE